MSDDNVPKIDPLTKEAWDYLMEVVGDYETFVNNIGNLGYSAPQVMYYRDEVQEGLDEFADSDAVNISGAYQKVVELDAVLRKKAQDLVDEIGHKNFIQYQIQNDPPRTHWWWWLNRITAPPPPPPKLWEFWKYQAFASSPEPAEPKLPEPEPPKNPDIAKYFQKGSTERPGD